MEWSEALPEAELNTSQEEFLAEASLLYHIFSACSNHETEMLHDFCVLLLH